MADEEQTELRWEIGYVLFIDIVRHSKLLLDEQKERLRELTEIVLAAGAAIVALKICRLNHVILGINAA
jgi:hypothetical protein